MKFLQIEITDNKRVDFTPVDVQLPDEAAKLIEQGIALADLADRQPGDGEIDIRTHAKTPGIRLGFIRIPGQDIDAEIRIRVVEKP